jgi:selenocysteine lyase/cysteine desulfurase
LPSSWAHPFGLRNPESAGRPRACFRLVALEAADLCAEAIDSSVTLRSSAVFDFDEKGVDSCVRLSPHYYNTDDEVDQVVAPVSEL